MGVTPARGTAGRLSEVRDVTSGGGGAEVLWPPGVGGDGGAQALGPGP